MSKHRDRGGYNTLPFAYMGIDGTLFRVDYHTHGNSKVYRAEYGLAATMIENGEVFE